MADAFAQPAADSMIAEFWTAATAEALNQALAERGLDADAIVAVFLIAADTMVSPDPSRFRVLARTRSRIPAAAVSPAPPL